MKMFSVCFILGALSALAIFLLVTGCAADPNRESAEECYDVVWHDKIVRYCNE